MKLSNSVLAPSKLARLHGYRRKWSVCWMKSWRKGDKNCVRVIAYHQLYIVHSCYHSNQVPHTLWWHWNDFECTYKNNLANILYWTRLTSSSLPCQCAWLAASWSFVYTSICQKWCMEAECLVGSVLTMRLNTDLVMSSCLKLCVVTYVMLLNMTVAGVG